MPEAADHGDAHADADEERTTDFRLRTLVSCP